MKAMERQVDEKDQKSSEARATRKPARTVTISVSSKNKMSPQTDDTTSEAVAASPKMSTRKLNVFYGNKQALTNVDLDILKNEVTALIGPSGCGKSTFLRCLNRMNDTIEGCRMTGKVVLDGQDIYEKSVDVVELRAEIGMVFQKPNPFPKTIYENVAYGPINSTFAVTRGPNWKNTGSITRSGRFSAGDDPPKMDANVPRKTIELRSRTQDRRKGAL